MPAVIMPHSTGPDWFTWRLQAGPHTWALGERPTVGEVEEALAGLPLVPGETVTAEGQAPVVRQPGEDSRTWPAWFVTIRAGDRGQVGALAVQVGARLTLAGLVEGPPEALRGPQAACGEPGRG